MHIGFLTPEYPHPKLGASGGLGTSIKNLAEALSAENVKVTVLVYGQKQAEVFAENGIAFHRIKQRRVPLLTWFTYRKYLQNYLNRVAQAEHIDLIEAPDWTGITAFMKLRVPLVIRFNGSDAYFCQLEGRKQKRKNFWFEKLALSHADALLSVSAFTADVTRQLFRLKKNITVIPNSIDCKKFVPKPDKTDVNRVLYYGSLIRKKGVLELPAIFNKMVRQRQETQFIFAGKDVIDVFTGVSTKQLILEQLDEKTKSQVAFLDELPYSAIQEEIAKATVVVLPSFAEAMPMTWLEAMAMEKALVTSDIGWASELMIDGETGYTVSPKSHDLYADRIVALLNDCPLREQLGKQARNQVQQHFSTEVIIQKNIEYYKNILNV